MNVSARLVQGAVLALAITANAIPLTTPSLAATVAVPPLVVTQLQHQVETLFTRDFIVIPGSGYTNSGFTATISTGDVVVVRIEAPQGKQFAVNAPSSVRPGHFGFRLYWQAAAELSSQQDSHTVQFENLVGPPPTETYSYVSLGNERHVVLARKEYTFTQYFAFSAIELRIDAHPGPATVTQTFGSVRSESDPSFDATSSPLNPVGPAMELVDVLPVLTRPTSWGRIKRLYR